MRWSSNRGVTLIEATIVLTVVAILASASAPTVSRSLQRARLARAFTDTSAIKTAIDTFITEFSGSFTPFTTNGLNAGGLTVEVLISDGDIPALGSGNASWRNPRAVGAAPVVDYMERHLVTNGVAYNTAACVLNNCWRGAYLSAPIDPDPWGNRYAVNVNFLRNTTTNDTFVLSAGPDEEVDTAYTVNGAVPGDDDIIAVVRRDPGLGVP